MRLVVQFDLDADIIDVPSFVIDRKDVFRKKFLRWLYGPFNCHRFLRRTVDIAGVEHAGMFYRGITFVEWINAKVLNKSLKKATVLEEYVTEYPSSLPVIYF